MKTLFAVAVGTVPLLATRVASAQNGSMMEGGGLGMGWMGAYGGILGPLLLVVAVIAVVAWIVRERGN